MDKCLEKNTLSTGFLFHAFQFTDTIKNTWRNVQQYCEVVKRMNRIPLVWHHYTQRAKGIQEC